jgi:pilus assembly protein CpaF
VELAVALIERLAHRLVESEVPLERRALDRAVPTLMREEAPLAGRETVQDVIDLLVGLGPLEALLRDPTISDILVNAPDEVWVERRGGLERSAIRFPDAEALVAAVERVIAPLGLRLDVACPAVDARLPDGSRLCAVIPPISVDGPIMAVRRFTQAVPDLQALVAAGGVRSEGAVMMRQAVQERRNLLVSGGTGSGKTTLLNVLSVEIPSHERVVTVEEAAELRLSGHVVRLEARPANAEGAGAVTVQQLVRHALRLRPDRIVVGEVRGPEALDMVTAMNSGHAGSMCTVHANTPDEALWRLETLAVAGERRVGVEAVRRQLRTGLDLVVQMERTQGGRRVASVASVRAQGCAEVYAC